MNTKNAQNNKIRQKVKKDTETNSNRDELVKNYVMGIGLTNETESSILEYIIKNIPQQHDSYYIVTPNPEMIVLASKDEEFKRVLNNARIALTDGMQLYRIARMLGVPLKERVVGTNFVEKLCEKVADRPITVGFLGGRPGIAEKAAECLREKYHGLKVVFAQSEWEEENESFDLTESRSTSHELRKKNEKSSPVILNSKFLIPEVDILFVAFGFPKQEKWMAEHVGKIPVKVMMGVGGALDQIVDPTLRPPAFVHKAGMGWLYRLIREPWRIKRQLKLVQFIQLAQKATSIQS